MLISPAGADGNESSADFWSQTKGFDLMVILVKKAEDYQSYHDALSERHWCQDTDKVATSNFGVAQRGTGKSWDNANKPTAITEFQEF